MPLDETWLIARVMFLIPLILSLSVHEWAHAWTAAQLGDSTAASQGRLTLNPLKHIDPVGTLLLPLMGVPFGWAKPVPINPGAFDSRVDMRAGLMLTAAAGPISNLVLAILGAIVLGVLARFGGLDAGGSWLEAGVLGQFIFLNLLLAFFNALPIPPLDGSRIVDGLCPDSMRPGWDAFARVGPVALVSVIVVPALLGFNLAAWPFAASDALVQIVLGFGSP